MSLTGAEARDSAKVKLSMIAAQLVPDALKSTLAERLLMAELQVEAYLMIEAGVMVMLRDVASAVKPKVAALEAAALPVEEEACPSLYLIAWIRMMSKSRLVLT